MLAAYLDKYVNTKLRKDIVPKAPFNDEIWMNHLLFDVCGIGGVTLGDIGGSASKQHELTPPDLGAINLSYT